MHSQGVLVSLNEVKNGQQHQYGQARHTVSTRPSPLKELEHVQLGNHPEHLVYIGSKLVEDIKSPLIRFLKQNMEVFA